MELQTVFYIMGIIYMSLMFILFLVLLAAVMTIKAKIDNVHEMIDERMSQVKSVTNKFTIGLNFLKHLVRK